MQAILSAAAACAIAGTLVPGSTELIGTAAGANYEVTVTNLTRGQQFTPILVASHKEWRSSTWEARLARSW